MTAAPRVIESPLLTPSEAAAYLRRKRTWVWTHRIELGAVLVGSERLYPRAALDAYLERRRERPQSEPVPLRRAPEGRRAALKHDSPVNELTGLPWGEYAPAAAPARGRGGR